MSQQLQTAHREYYHAVANTLKTVLYQIMRHTLLCIERLNADSEVQAAL